MDPSNASNSARLSDPASPRAPDGVAALRAALIAFLIIGEVMIAIFLFVPKAMSTARRLRA